MLSLRCFLQIPQLLYIWGDGFVIKEKYTIFAISFMKRVLFIFLCVLANVISMAQASTIVDSGTYETVNWCFYSDGLLVISGSGVRKCLELSFCIAEKPWNSVKCKAEITKSDLPRGFLAFFPRRASIYCIFYPFSFGGIDNCMYLCRQKRIFDLF